MFNFLPEQEKKKLRAEYVRRRLTMFLEYFFIVIIISLLLLVPLYVLSYAKKSAAQVEEVGVRKTYGDTLAVPLAEINHTKDLLKLIGTGRAATSSSFLISTVTSLRPVGIRISSITLKFGNQTEVQLQGIAATRDALRGFKDNLEGAKLFERVDIPVSSFAKDAEIPFTIGLTIPKLKP